MSSVSDVWRKVWCSRRFSNKGMQSRTASVSSGSHWRCSTDGRAGLRSSSSKQKFVTFCKNEQDSGNGKSLSETLRKRGALLEKDEEWSTSPGLRPFARLQMSSRTSSMGAGCENSSAMACNASAEPRNLSSRTWLRWCKTKFSARILPVGVSKSC